MHLRRLIILLLGCSLGLPASAQITVSRGVNLSVDAAADGRLATDLLGDLWIVPAGGGEARQLTKNLKSVRRPRWSPDAKSVVYQASHGGQHRIWVYDIESGKSRDVSANSYLDLYPDWHPNGERIVYSSDRSGQGLDLWEYDLATGLRWRLSDRPGDEMEAAWSEDGRNLVYVSRRAERWSLILRRHGQPEEVLLKTTEQIAAPSWRPDGSLITYFRKSAAQTSAEMVILSEPRLVRTYMTSESYAMKPVSWLDRQRMIYSANGQIRQRLFNSWKSSSIPFRAEIQPASQNLEVRERHELAWLDEPLGEIVIHAARMFDGINAGYQYNRDLMISGGRVTAVEDHSERPGAIVFDMGDLTIIPGFIDADALLPGKLRPGHGPELLAKGITTVVGRHADLDHFNALWSGKNVPGPRFLSADQWQIGELLLPDLDVTAAVTTSHSLGRPTGAALAMQFRAMSIAGLSAEQTLRALGVNAAAAILADPFLGRIAIGAAADLVFVHGDPLAQIDNALNVVAVVRNGRFYSVSGLRDKANYTETVE